MAPNWAIFGHFPVHLAIILVILLSSFPIGLGASDGGTSTKNSECSTVLDAFMRNTKCLPGKSDGIAKCYQSILVPENSAKPAKRFQLGRLECGGDGGQPIPIGGDKLTEDAMADGAHLEDIFSEFLIPKIGPNAKNVVFLPQTCQPDSPPSTSTEMSITTTQPFIPELNEKLILAEKLSPGMGYLLRATPKANWVRISIGLIQNGTDGKETTLLRFIADANIGQLKVESDHGKNNPTLVKENTVIKGGQKFEIQFNLNQTHIDVVLDDVKIYALEKKDPEIHGIKIEADFDITANKATLMTPIVRPITFGSKQIIILGKVKKYAKSFTVNIIRNRDTTQNITEENQCSEKNYTECDLPLCIDIDFKDNKIFLTSLDYGSGVKTRRNRSNEIANKIKPGDSFEIKIGVVSGTQFSVEFSGDPYIVDVQQTDRHYLEVKGDILLFGEPKQ